jgi:hypothetical protein
MNFCQFLTRRIGMKKNKKAQRSKDERTSFFKEKLREYDEEQLAEFTGGGESVSNEPDKDVHHREVVAGYSQDNIIKK